MVVHDKINLQNSLDLAAYYGAKKQAEVLNVMAHINYQMRQNWKLLAWRYRILGTLAQYKGYHKNIPGTKYWCPQNSDENIDCSKPTDCHSYSPYKEGGGYCDRAYFICISHDIWIRGVVDIDSEKNLCTKSGVDITLVTQVENVGGPLIEFRAAQRGIDALIKKIARSCPLEGSLNWLMAQLFITHFRLDQRDRKLMIEEIYNKTLREGIDLDGKSIFEGAKKVFKQNLTKANYKSFKDSELIPFDSFKYGNKEFDKVFGKINVAPVLQFIHARTKDTNVGNCNQEIGYHYQTKASSGKYIFRDELETGWPEIFEKAKGRIDYLFQYNKKNFLFDPTTPMKELTLSFFKIPEEILYYGLKVDFQYKPKYQIFSLISEGINFRATAFAKPFGGQFGPQPKNSDLLIQAASTHGELNRKFIHKAQPNYSRWPGDQWGLIDKNLHDNKELYVFLNKHYRIDSKKKRIYNLEDYIYPIISEIPDPLARNVNIKSDEEKAFSFTRIMELMAVYPDLYDITYYSIMANYHQSYFQKVCNLLKGSDCNPKAENKFSAEKGNPKETGPFVRGDFGWPFIDKYIEKQKEEPNISIAPYFLNTGGNAINKNPSLIKFPKYKQDEGLTSSHDNDKYGSNKDLVKPPYPKTKGNLFYPWLANPLPDKILSSWTSPKSGLNYNEDQGYNQDVEQAFLDCHTPAAKGRPVPSACVGMGRSGYSVKLISCDVIKPKHHWCSI